MLGQHIERDALESLKIVMAVARGFESFFGTSMLLERDDC